MCGACAGAELDFRLKKKTTSMMNAMTSSVPMTAPTILPTERPPTNTVMVEEARSMSGTISTSQLICAPART